MCYSVSMGTKRTLEDVRQTFGVKAPKTSGPMICDGCGKETPQDQWAQKRVMFFRSKRIDGIPKQQQIGAYSAGRYCPDCIVAELTENKK